MNKAVNRKRDCYSMHCSVRRFVSNRVFYLSVILLLAAAFLQNSQKESAQNLCKFFNAGINDYLNSHISFDI